MFFGGITEPKFGDEDIFLTKTEEEDNVDVKEAAA